MKIIKKIESREQCVEAGWFAYDYLLDKKIDKDFILSLRSLGSFVFLTALAKPFFKIEADHYLIKGVLGDTFFRMAVHKDFFTEMKRVEELISSLK